MWPWRVKMPTQNMLRLFLLLMLVMRILLATLCCWFGSWGLVIKLNLFRLSILVKIVNLKFRRDFEAEVWSAFCCWCLMLLFMAIVPICLCFSVQPFLWNIYYIFLRDDEDPDHDSSLIAMGRMYAKKKRLAGQRKRSLYLIIHGVFSEMQERLRLPREQPKVLL